MWKKKTIELEALESTIMATAASRRPFLEFWLALNGQIIRHFDWLPAQINKMTDISSVKDHSLFSPKVPNDPGA